MSSAKVFNLEWIYWNTCRAWTSLNISKWFLCRRARLTYSQSVAPIYIPTARIWESHSPSSPGLRNLRTLNIRQSSGYISCFVVLLAYCWPEVSLRSFPGGVSTERCTAAHFSARERSWERGRAGAAAGLLWAHLAMRPPSPAMFHSSEAVFFTAVSPAAMPGEGLTQDLSTMEPGS